MQSAAFRSTLRQFATTSATKNPATKQRGVISLMVKDIGNFPLLMANSFGGLAVLIFGSRKLFFHPDIGISENNRLNDAVQNETEQRMESAHQFRSQTRMFASILHPLSSPIISFFTGQKKGNGGEEDQWGLYFLRNVDAMKPPLESTAAFDDDLFLDIEPVEFVKNEPAQLVIGQPDSV